MRAAAVVEGATRLSLLSKKCHTSVWRFLHNRTITLEL
jgi:hypothetical protein